MQQPGAASKSQEKLGAAKSEATRAIAARAIAVAVAAVMFICGGGGGGCRGKYHFWNTTVRLANS